MPKVREYGIPDGQRFIQESLSAATGKNTLNIEELSDWMGVSRNTAKEFLTDVPFLPMGGRNGRRYLVSDVAAKIWRERVET